MQTWCPSRLIRTIIAERSNATFARMELHFLNHCLQRVLACDESWGLNCGTYTSKPTCSAIVQRQAASWRATGIFGQSTFIWTPAP
jgi:hypothetical protein